MLEIAPLRIGRSRLPAKFMTVQGSLADPWTVMLLDRDRDRCSVTIFLGDGVPGFGDDAPPPAGRTLLLACGPLIHTY